MIVIFGNEIFYLDVCRTPSHFGCVQLFVTPWTVTRQAALSMGFSRTEYWSGLPFPSPMQEGEKMKVKSLSRVRLLDVKVSHSICQQIWKTQQWPQDWKRPVFIPICPILAFPPIFDQQFQWAKNYQAKRNVFIIRPYSVPPIYFFLNIRGVKF